MKKNFCMHCGKKISAKKYSEHIIKERGYTHRRYCNAICQNRDQSEKKVQAWLKGDFDGVRSRKVGSLSNPVRRWILERDNKACVLCGWNEINPTTGTSPLNVDHIDGDALNNRPENLRTLCPNCHSLTSNYRSLNIGKSTRNKE